MQKLEPIWQNLPFFFKSQVVEKLDYKDRCSLRKCSKSDQHLVDQTSNILKCLAINTYENYSFLSWTDDGDTIHTVKYFKNFGDFGAKFEFSASPRVFLPGKNQKTIFKKTRILADLNSDSDDLDFALDDFKIAIGKLKTEKLIINDYIIKEFHPPARPDRTLEFRERLLTLLNLLNPLTSLVDQNKGQKHPIKAKTLRLKWHQESDEISQILSHFDPKWLKNLEFSDRNATWRMEPIVRMAQWKCAEKVWLEVLTDLKSGDLAPFSEIQMHIRHMDEHDLWTVIQNFISKNRHGSSFHFTYRQGEPDLQRILDTFNVPIEDKPIRAGTQIRSILERRINHTQRFKMANPELVLVVMIADKEVWGTVCHVANVDVEAKVETGMLR